MVDNKGSITRQTIEALLPLVQTPSHYLGSEVNTIRKDPKAVRFRMALAFPDLYEVGMSHLGIQILYHLLNARADVAAERVFVPRGDLEAHLRTHGLPLCSMETRTPLALFDVIGFSLLFELNFTNILNILSLSRVPLFSCRRTESDPVIIAGGPCTFNPEPLAEFFDAMVIGDGEEVVLALVDTWLEWKEAGEDRQGLLRRWARLPGIYIPSFFETCWDQKGHQILQPKEKDYETIRKAVVSDLNLLPYPDRPVIPYGKPVHDRLNIEICRGCTRGCRFCQAGMIYRPVRERAPSTILSLADHALCHTGYDDLSLLSLSAGDYCSLSPLMASLMSRCEMDKVAVSLPSLRVGSLTESLMSQIKRVRKTGFTLAPEAGSARLRNVINKNITEEDLQEDIDKAFTLGWRLIKLYFMIGLPTEQDEDVDAIVDLVGRLRKGHRKGKTRDINVSVSTFVPKAHTPFQWARQISLEETEEKLRSLRGRLTGKGLRFKWQNPQMSVLEGLWARGDRRLAQLLVKAFEMGCRLDGWSDQFQYGTWMKAMEATGIQIEQYSRARDLDEPLPWDHIHSGVSKEFLRQEWNRAMTGDTTADCRMGDCQGCGVCDFDKVRPVIVEANPDDLCARKSADHSGDREFKKLWVSYSKMGVGRFFGHLEMVKIILRAFKRAAIPLRYTEGFHPAAKISFSPPIPVGIESTQEHFLIETGLSVSPETLVSRLNGELPRGLEITRCVPLESSAFPQDVVFDYMIRLTEETFSIDRMAFFEKSPSWPLERTNKKGQTKTIDLKKVVTHLERLGPDTLRMRIDFSCGQHVRVTEVLETVFSLSQRAVAMASIVKAPANPVHF